MSSKKNYYKEKMMRRKEEKKEEPETPRYRDRAKERREDQNPDYEPTELGSFHAVAPPGTDLRLADAHKISIEKSKYLGGDLEHTHLVKGLDYALLHKVRSEIEKKPDAEDGKDAKSRATKEDQAVSFRTAAAKSVYQWIIKPQSIIKENELFLPGRMSFIYNMVMPLKIPCFHVLQLHNGGGHNTSRLTIYYKLETILLFFSTKTTRCIHSCIFHLSSVLTDKLYGYKCQS